MFYKYENEHLISGSIVTFPNGNALQLAYKDTYDYPFSGYYYFETEELAKDFFGIPYEVITPEVVIENVPISNVAYSNIANVVISQ